MSRHLELRHLQAFVAVAEELHFTRAAKRLHVVQQALSTQIRDLEDELGTTLFVRTTRSVELTEAGETLLSHAKPLLAALDVAREQTQQAGKGERGSLTVAYTPTVANKTLPLLTREMHSRYPAIRLRAYETWQADALAAVTAGRLNVGFARCTGPFDGLNSIVVRRESLGAVFGSKHQLAPREVVGIRHIGGETLAIWPRVLSPNYYDLVTSFLDAHGFHGPIQEFENLNRDVFFGDPAARSEMVAGRAFSVAFASEPLPAGFIWRRLEPAPQVPLSLFWRQSADRVTLSFVEMVEEVAGIQGWLKE